MNSGAVGTYSSYKPCQCGKMIHIISTLVATQMQNIYKLSFGALLLAESSQSSTWQVGSGLDILIRQKVKFWPDGHPNGKPMESPKMQQVNSSKYPKVTINHKGKIVKSTLYRMCPVHIELIHPECHPPLSTCRRNLHTIFSVYNNTFWPNIHRR